jgi:hypothetical protein
LLLQMWPEGLTGIEVKVEGFAHKLPLLVASIVRQLVGLQVPPALSTASAPCHPAANGVVLHMLGPSSSPAACAMGALHSLGLALILCCIQSLVPEAIRKVTTVMLTWCTQRGMESAWSLNRLLHAQVDASRFGRVREALARRYANANMSPGKHAAYLRLRALKHVWHVDDALAELNALTPAAVQARACLDFADYGACSGVLGSCGLGTLCLAWSQ